MKNYFVSTDSMQVKIHGIPDAVKIIKLENIPESKRLADLCSHKVDLEFSINCLELINANMNPIIREALWRSSIIHFIKCFKGSSARGATLDKKKIFKNQLGREAFDYFVNIRDKHIAHDENAYHTCLPGAAINDETKNYKIDDVICVTFLALTLEQENFNNLNLLIKDALKYVTNQFDILSIKLKNQLEKYSFENLNQMETIEYKLPNLEDVSKKKKQ